MKTTNLHPVEPKICPCGETFTPKPGGYNAVYCSDRCRAKGLYRRFVDRSTPKQRYEGRHDVWRTIKADPKRLAVVRNANANQKAIVRQWLAAYKMRFGCIDCGYVRHPAALQLDHEGKKTASISEIRTSIQRILREIQSGKCVVRCANCHAIKTAMEKNGIKYDPKVIWEPTDLARIGEQIERLLLAEREGTNECAATAVA